MVHAIFFRSEVRAIVCERERVGRGINLRDDFHAILFSQFLQGDEFSFRIAAVAGSQPRIGVAFKTEGGLRLRPVIVKIFFEAIIVQVQVQGVHLVEPHHAY